MLALPRDGSDERRRDVMIMSLRFDEYGIVLMESPHHCLAGFHTQDCMHYTLDYTHVAVFVRLGCAYCDRKPPRRPRTAFSVVATRVVSCFGTRTSQGQILSLRVEIADSAGAAEGHGTCRCIGSCHAAARFDQPIPSN